MDQEHLSALRKQLTIALSGTESHISFEKAVREFPPELRGTKLPGAPHSAWELLEHMRIAQWDILEFSRDSKHSSPEFPKGYWPQSALPPSETAWDDSVTKFLHDRREFGALLEKGDLFAPFAHGDGQTLLREAVVLANHNSYHLGELVFLKRQLLEKL